VRGYSTCTNCNYIIVCIFRGVKNYGSGGWGPRMPGALVHCTACTTYCYATETDKRSNVKHVMDMMLTVNVKDERSRYSKFCEDAYNEAKKQTEMNNRLWLDSPWKDFFTGRDPTKLASTGVTADTVDHILRIFSSDPPEPDFSIHHGI